ncbi:MAG TPA: ATP-binding protein, partial [Burkholderiales bacterium]
RKDGTRFWARVVVTAMHDADGRLRGFAKVTQDLTQRQHSQAVEVAARQVQDFIAVLAHELRNPLAPIRNAAQLLKDPSAGPEAFEVACRAIDRQSAQLARIVDDLLDVGRITRGTFSVQLERVDLRDTVQRAIETARPGIEAAEHQLRIELPPGALFVNADALRLAQALTNVLNNAARYTDPRGQITLSLRREQQGDHSTAVISVTDTGRGIDKDFLGSIFGMFVQGRHAASRSQTGLGVGLALARTIVELHHGSIEAKSEGAGKGSEFVIGLPMQDSGQLAAAGAQPSVTHELTNGVAHRVLVVDDNVDAASMLAALVRQLGHDVVVVHDGPSALQAAEAYRPEVILLDLGMPGMNGFEVARSLRERGITPAPRIVAITGWGKPEDERRTREAGFDMHLIKPVEESQIRQALRLRGPRPTRH